VLYGILSDTHGRLHPDVAEVFAGVNEILHAGDVGSESVLDELEGIAPVIAVCGNVEPPALERRLPEVKTLEREGLRIVLLHGHLVRAARPPELLDAVRARKPDLVVFGHTHRALEETLEGVVFFNPGSAGPARFGSRPTVGTLQIGPDGLHLRHHRLDRAGR
jgi:putative phosphoesterase